MGTSVGVDRGDGDRQIERRRHTRQSVSLHLREIRPYSRVLACHSLGVGGLFCPVSEPIPVGRLLVLEIDLENGIQPFVAPAWVVRNGAGDRAGTGVGLKFMVPQTQIGEYLNG